MAGDDEGTLAVDGVNDPRDEIGETLADSGSCFKEKRLVPIRGPVATDTAIAACSGR
jgi:hypothetical protein